MAGRAAPINTYEFVTRNVTIHGIETGSRAMFEDLNRFLTQHDIRPVIDQVYALPEVGDALRRVESGGHMGKVVLSW